VDPADWQKVNEMVVDAAASLFEACGVKLEYLGVATAEDPPFDTTLSVIGYAGEHMRGSVLLSAPDTVLRATHPMGSSAGDDDLLDWSGELTNQLLGRIKNKVRKAGILIQMSTPMILSGLHLRISSLRSSECVAHKFMIGEAHKFALGDVRVQVRFEAIIEPGIRFDDAGTSSDAPPAGEGDVLLF
jgi:chemotaxis protein CheX